MLKECSISHRRIIEQLGVLNALLFERKQVHTLVLSLFFLSGNTLYTIYNNVVDKVNGVIIRLPHSNTTHWPIFYFPCLRLSAHE